MIAIMTYQDVGSYVDEGSALLDVVATLVTTVIRVHPSLISTWLEGLLQFSDKLYILKGMSWLLRNNTFDFSSLQALKPYVVPWLDQFLSQPTSTSSESRDAGDIDEIKALSSTIVCCF